MREFGRGDQDRSRSRPGSVRRVALGAFGAVLALGPGCRAAEHPAAHDSGARREIATAAPTPPPPTAIPAPPRGKLPGPEDYVYVEKLPEAITTVAPEYPQVARESGMEGTVIVRALVDVDGRVVDAFVAQGDIAVLNGPAVASVRKWTFKPARAGGAPVAVWVAVPVRFSLR
jgi:TonB family protein